MKLEFTVPAVPVGQPRARATVGHNGRARMHEAVSLKQADGTRKPHPILAFKATVKHAAAAVYSGAPLDCPLSLEALFVFPRPQQMRWKSKPMPREWHSKKPDCDNLLKGLMDALTGLVWTDDDRVSLVTVKKVIANGEEQPHVVVWISTLED